MIKLNHNLSLDLYYNEEKTIDTKEYDKNSRYITVSLTYKGKEYQISGDTIKARIKWLKPDEKAVFNDCAINSDNTITIDLTEQMLITSGVAKATLSLCDINTDQVLSTTSFNAIIEASAISDDTILSSDEFKTVQSEFKKLDELNKTVTECENIRQKNEESRKSNETKRETNESERINSENARINNENTRIDSENERVKNENTRIANENVRQHNEATRETQEDKRESDTAIAIEKANEAAKNANDKANDLQTKLDNHHFVLTNELENSVSSTSTTHAPTANAVKIVNDKLDSHTNNRDNPHNITKEQIGLGNNDNTADMDKPVSTAQQKAIDDAYANSNKYTDKKIADLIGGAPETLDTLKEVADAIAENKTIVEALDSAIGKKANQAELDTHTGNNVIHITSAEHEGLTEAILHTKTEHVTGVKGSAESIYRTDNVEITAENVGALSLKNGGNVTGDTSFQGKRRVHYVDDGTGRAGYDKIARFTANSAYNNAAIEIELARRTDTVPTHVAIMFAGNACYAVTCMGHTKDVFMCKESDGVWVLYVKKTHEWCTTSVLDYVHSPFADGVTVEWIVSSSANYAESLPNTEIISGSWGYIVKEAMEANGTATVLDYNDTSKKIKVGWVGNSLSQDQILGVACYSSGDDDTVKAKIKDVSKDTFKNWLGAVSPSDGSNNYVKVFNSSNVNSSDNLTVNDLADQGFAAAMIAATEDSPIGSGWFHALNLGWGNSKNNWVSQIALGTQPNDGLYYRTTGASIVGKPWKRVLDSSNYTNYALKAESLSDIDLNNVTTSGIYYLSGTLTNNPLSCNATLLVDFNVGTPYQIFMPDYTYNMYKRTYSSSTWGEWYEFGGSSSSSVAWDNITGRPSSYPPETHNHNTSDSDFGCTLPNSTTATYADLNSNGYTTGFFLKTIRGQYTAPSWFEGNYASGIAFGGADTHAVISCRYEFPRVTFCGGNGTEPNWWYRLQGTSGHNYMLDDFITTSGTDRLAGSIIPNEDVAMDLGDSTHRFTNVYSSNITTGAIWMEHDSNAIYESGNDAANGNGGGLNNLVVRSWWGVSFTSNCAGGRYGGKDQTAVGIDCREGIVRAYNFAGLINGHSVNADVPLNANYIESYGSSDNYVFSNYDGSNSGTNYYYIRYTNGFQMVFIETHNDHNSYNNANYKRTISFPVSFVNNKYFAFGKQNVCSDGVANKLVSFGEKNNSSITIYHYPYGYNEAPDYFSMFFVGRWK